MSALQFTTGHAAVHFDGITPKASNIPVIDPDPIPALAEEIDRVVRQFTGHTGALPDFAPMIRKHLNR